MRTKVPTEHAEQVTLVQWLRRQYPGVLIFAIPNGGQRNAAVALKLKLEGVVRGVPDLYIPAWRTWIEMKRDDINQLRLRPHPHEFAMYYDL